MIEFINIKSNERVKLTDPHQIGAYINSSDLGINATKGQDFGWRLAPSIIVKIDEMRNDPELLDKISQRIGVSMEEISVLHLAQYLSSLDDMKFKTDAAREANNPEFKKSYEAEIEALKNPTPVANSIKPEIHKKK